ncbi:hypothetical protein D1007_48653 [Hordeum vulgare]|nr:hypothetical protein D1007_48653 [Hordeum vulgare]
MNCRVVAWLLVAGLVLGSCTTGTCSSRLLLDTHPCRKELIQDIAADHAEAAGAEVRRFAGGGYRGGEPAVSRRSLGQRAPSPPAPQPNKRLATKMPSPPPPSA